MKELKEVYFGGRLKDRAADILKDLEKGLYFPQRYLILAPLQETGHIEIVPSLQLIQSGYPAGRFRLAGVAASKEESTELLLSITEDALKAGFEDPAAFLRSRP